MIGFKLVHLDREAHGSKQPRDLKLLSWYAKNGRVPKEFLGTKEEQKVNGDGPHSFDSLSIELSSEPAY